jgi:acyl-CoA reductase-like NAD-dependent aldehyde dehydrogenase
MVNSTNYGLGSSIFTTDYKKADRVTRQLECGMVSVNDFGMVPMVQSLPFGGIKVPRPPAPRLPAAAANT